MSVHPLVVALASVLLSVLAQVALKLGTTRALAAEGVRADNEAMVRALAAGLTHPMVLLGFALYVLGGILWLYVLARWDVSKAYPLVGLGFLLTLAIGTAFMGEQLSWPRALGCLLMCGGLALIVRS